MTDHARRRRQVADELRDLADRIEDRLPEKGAVTELARRLDKRLDEMRPYRDPRARQKQARRLGELLSKRTGVNVHLRYDPTKHWNTNKPGYYRVRWANGPTFETMNAHVSDAVARARLDLIDTTALSLERDGGGRCQLAALFRHLALNPETNLSGHIRLHTYTRPNGTSFTYHKLEEFASEIWLDTDYPERLNDQWKPQLDAFTKVLRERRCHREYDILAELLHDHGWTGTRARLEQIAAGLVTEHGDLNVTRLDQHRPRPTPPTASL